MFLILLYIKHIFRKRYLIINKLFYKLYIVSLGMGKKKVLIMVIILAFVFLILITYSFYFRGEKNPYNFKGNTLSYSENRSDVDYNKILIEENKTFDVFKVDFDTRQLLNENIRIYGLLYLPKNANQENKVPGIIFLAGGGGTKESRREIAEEMVKMNYAVLVIDQRGLGETGGSFLSFDEDYKIFKQGKEPMQHLAVYDVLRSFDFLNEAKEVDKNRISIVGESMGARYGLIASAIDKRMKGIVAISTSGFHINLNPLAEGNDYFLSIDPDHYIDKISPNKIFMIHCINDSVVKLEDAEKSFSIAKEPKKLKIFENCAHGYNPIMRDELRSDLKDIFG